MKFGYSMSGHKETLWENTVRFIVLAIMGAGLILAIGGNFTFVNRDIFRCILTVIGTSAFLYVFTLFARKTVDSYKVWLTMIFIAALILRIIMINTWKIAPTSDFKDTYEAALALADADISNLASVMRGENSYYYASWPVHLPFILIKMAIIKVFGEDIYPIQVIFNIFSAGSCVAAAMVAKSLYGRRAGITAGVFMCVFPLSLMYSAVLTNQHMATFFFLLSIYFIIDKPKKYKLRNVFFAGLSAAVAQLIRPEMQVYVIAVICYFLYKYIFSVRYKSSMKDAARKFASYSVMFLCVYIVAIYAVNLPLMQSGMIKESLMNTNYRYKIATGLNRETRGAWNEKDALHSTDYDELDRRIKERSSDFGQVLKLGAEKIAFQYGTYDYSWCIEGKSGGFVEKWYGPLTNDVMLVILILALMRVALAAFRRSRRELFVMIIMAGYFLIFMVIEIQNRYNYFAIPIFVIFACGSMEYICDEGLGKLKKAFVNMKDSQNKARA